MSPSWAQMSRAASTRHRRSGRARIHGGRRRRPLLSFRGLGFWGGLRPDRPGQVRCLAPSQRGRSR
eukprot:13017521-Alexandrium_andersonii.AAC.1